MVRKFGGGIKDSKGSYAAGVRLGNAKFVKWAHRASGGRCMGDVEGDKPKMNFGRPGRASGGSVKKKADGDWVGEGDSGKALKERSAQKSKDAGDDNTSANSAGLMGVTAAANHFGGPKMREMGAVGKTLKTGNAAAAIGGLGLYGLGKLASKVKRDQAASDSKAGDEAEGRKFGGRARMKKKG